MATQENQEELRAARALALVQLGELSSARQALEGRVGSSESAHVARVCNEDQVYLCPISRDLLEMSPPESQLEEDLFLKTFRSTMDLQQGLRG